MFSLEEWPNVSYLGICDFDSSCLDSPWLAASKTWAWLTGYLLPGDVLVLPSSFGVSPCLSAVFDASPPGPCRVICMSLRWLFGLTWLSGYFTVRAWAFVWSLTATCFAVLDSTVWMLVRTSESNCICVAGSPVLSLCYCGCVVEEARGSVIRVCYSPAPGVPLAAPVLRYWPSAWEEEFFGAV